MFGWTKLFKFISIQLISIHQVNSADLKSSNVMSSQLSSTPHKGRGILCWTVRWGFLGSNTQTAMGVHWKRGEKGVGKKERVKYGKMHRATMIMIVGVWIEIITHNHRHLWPLWLIKILSAHPHADETACRCWLLARCQISQYVCIPL